MKETESTVNTAAELLALPSDGKRREVEEKALAWLSAGVSAVLVVDPQTQSVRHYRSASEIHLARPGAIVDLDAVVTGFQLDVAELFA